MKIKYDLKREKNFKVFNDSLGVALNRNNILRSKKVKYMNYLTMVILELLVSTIFLSLMILLTYRYYCLLSICLTIFGAGALIYVIINASIPLLFANCFFRKDEGELEVNEKGITFALDDEEALTIGWTHFKGVIVGRHSINLVTDYKYYFYFDKKYDKEIIEAVKKYNQSIIIVK